MGPVYCFLQHRDYFILGWSREKGDFWYWKVAIAGNCWDFYLFLRRIVCCCAGCLGKKTVLELESGDCWDLLGHPPFCVVYCCLAVCPGKRNDFWVGKIIFVKLEGDLLGFPRFCFVYCFLADCSEKKKGDFWVAKITLWLSANCCNLPRFPLSALSTVAWQIAPEKPRLGRFEPPHI